MKTVFKIFTLLAAVVFSASCGEENVQGGGSVAQKDLVVSFDKSVIQASGNDVVTFRIYYKGKEVSDQQDVFLYKVTGKNSYELMTSRSFSTTVLGQHSFQVGYLTLKSDVLTISAIERPIPAAPADGEPNNTSFVHRTFFNQHTGSQCPNCPFMTYLLRQTLNDEVKDKVVLASVRNYTGENGFASIPNPANSWPYLHIDFTDTYPYNGSVDGLRNIINEITSEPADVGIAAKAQYYDDGQIVVKVAVKAAKTKEYNVGLWLMQDNYKATQTVATDRLHLLNGTWGDSYHYHDNSVRVAESKYLNSHVGYSLGTVRAGETAEWVFLVNVNHTGKSDLNTDGVTNHHDGTWWEGRSKVNLDDLHFAAFVTTPTMTQKGLLYPVVNAIDFPYNGEASFEYSL